MSSDSATLRGVRLGLSLSLAGMFATAEGQVVFRYDAARGVYVVTAHNDAGDPVPLEITPPDRVVVSSIATGSVLSDGRVAYRFEIKVAPTSPQELSSIGIRCPVGGRHTAFRIAPPGVPEYDEGRAITVMEPFIVCQYLVGAKPGQSAYAKMESAFLPAISELYALGKVPWGGYPTSDPDGDDDLQRVVDSLLGEGPGGLRARAVSLAPERDPSAVGGPPGLVTAMREDVDRVCASSLGWITSTTRCNRLRTLLGPAGVRFGEIKGILGDGLQGADIHQNAFTLLDINLEYLRRQVDFAGITLTYVCGNRFRIRNPNAIPLWVSWGMVGKSPKGDLTVPARTGTTQFGEVTFDATVKGSVRLLYEGTALATAANAEVACTP